MPGHASLALDHLDLDLPQSPRDGQQRGQGRRLVPAVVAHLEVRRGDAALTEDGVEGDPAALDPDLDPHVEAEERTAARLARVDQADGRARGDARGAAHGREQEGVLAAVAL